MPGFVQIQKQRDPSADMLSRMMMQLYAMKLEDKYRDKTEQRQIAKEKRDKAAFAKYMDKPIPFKSVKGRDFMGTPKGWVELKSPKEKQLAGDVKEYEATHKKIPTPTQLKKYRKEKAAEVLANQKNLVKFNAKLRQEAKETADLNQVPSWNQQRNLDTVLKATEQKLLDPDLKGDPRLEVSANYFNKYSSAKYVYLKKTTTRKKGFFGKETIEDWVRTPVPQAGGKKYTAKDVTAMAVKYNKTVEEVLRDMGLPMGVNP